MMTSYPLDACGSGLFNPGDPGQARREAHTLRPEAPRRHPDGQRRV